MAIFVQSHHIFLVRLRRSASSKPALLLQLLRHAQRPLDPAYGWRRLLRGALSLLSILISPHPIFLTSLTVSTRVLIAVDSFPPLLASCFRINHDIDLLGVVPALGVLVPRTLYTDVPVGDEEFDVTRSLLELVMNGFGLVFGRVPIDI